MEEIKSLESPTGAALKAGGGAEQHTPLLNDTTSLPAEIAAIYLGMSPSELADFQKSKRFAGRAASGAPATGRIDKGAKAQTPPTSYALGDVRALGRTPGAPSGLDAVAKAGLLGWLTLKLPFFAELEPRVKRGRRVLIGSAWDAADPERDARFAALLAGRIRLSWLTSTEAAASLWSDAARHRAFVARGQALLDGETQAIGASVAATERLAADTSNA